MIVKGRILSSLNSLEKLYLQSNNNEKEVFFSKLAILELCGWIEVSMDDVVLKCAKRKIKDQKVIKKIENEVIKPNYGFKYNENFRLMLQVVVGEIALTKIETKILVADLSDFKALLGMLKKLRDKEAHTYISDKLKTLDAPSWTMSNFRKVYKGLKMFDSALRENGF